MSFTWYDVYGLGRWLEQQSSRSPYKEAMLRSTISRIYYAIFILARNFLRDKDKDTSIPTGGNVHTYVINKLVNSPDRRRRKSGTILYNLRRQRNRADYDDVFVDLARAVQAVISDAQLALDILAKL